MAKVWNDHISVNLGPMEAPSSVPDSPQPQGTTSKLSENFLFLLLWWLLLVSPPIAAARKSKEGDKGREQAMKKEVDW
jgi:hypothetical protein